MVCDTASDGGRRSSRLDWTTWQQWLDSQLGHNPDTVDEAAQAANATFDYLHNAFSSDTPSGA